MRCDASGRACRLTGDSAVVLLVEDEERAPARASALLETRGYTVHEAGSGIEALEIMTNSKAPSISSSPRRDCRRWTGPDAAARAAQDISGPEVHFVSGYAKMLLREICRPTRSSASCEALLSEATRGRRARDARQLTRFLLQPVLFAVCRHLPHSIGRRCKRRAGQIPLRLLSVSAVTSQRVPTAIRRQGAHCSRPARYWCPGCARPSNGKGCRADTV